MEATRHHRSRTTGPPRGTVNLSSPRAIFAGSPPRFTRSRVTYEAYAASRISTRPQVDSAIFTAVEHTSAGPQLEQPVACTRAHCDREADEGRRQHRYKNIPKYLGVSRATQRGTDTLFPSGGATRYFPRRGATHCFPRGQGTRCLPSAGAYPNVRCPWVKGDSAHDIDNP